MARTRCIIVLTLVLTLLVPASAMAATVREYQLQYDPTGDATGALMIVSALVDPQVALPVTVTVPVPRGATLLWAGEVLGGDVADDPSRDTTMEQAGDMDVYTLTLEQAYTAQLEIQLPAATISEDSVRAEVAWTNPGEEVLVTASVIAEAGATDVKITPDVSGATQTNDAGEQLYPLVGTRVATNGAYDITVEWKRSSAVNTESADASPLPALLGALVVAILALVIVVVRERTRSRRSAAAISDRES